MKLGIILFSDDEELIWNAFRLAVLACKKKDSVKVFLLAKGVEIQSLDSEKFKITEMMHNFIHAGGEILACGTCLKLRDSQSNALCPISTMEDLYSLIKDSDKVITF